MDDIVNGLVKSSRERPPKVQKVKCGTCRLYQKENSLTTKMLKCEKYPEGIPTRILTEAETCSEFQVKAWKSLDR